MSAPSGAAALWHAAHSLLAAVFAGLDGRDYALIGYAFNAQGTWYRQGKALAGSATIIAEMEARPADLTTMHVVSNLLRLEGPAEAACFQFYLTVYCQPQARLTDAPLPMPLPSAIGVCGAEIMQEGASYHLHALRTGGFTFAT